MIDCFWLTRWCIAIMPGDSLDIFPKWQQPSLEVILRDMWIEPVLDSYPLLHLRLCIGGIGKVIRTRVYICQRNHGV